MELLDRRDQGARLKKKSAKVAKGLIAFQWEVA